MTRRRNTAGALPERAWQQQVEQLAAFYGWATYHTHDSRRSTPGFPDLTMVRDAELLFVELKTASGRVRPDQAVWIKALAVVAAATDAVDVYIWRPADFDAVHARLARGRTRLEPV